MGTRVNGVDLSAGLSNPMTTAGDIITGGASGTPGRLAVGAEGEVLTVTGGEPGWAAPAGGIDTSLQSAPDTGWTAAGDGSAAISGGVATVTVTPAQASGVLRRAQVVCSPFLPAIEVIARVTVTTVPAAGSYYAGIGVINADIPANASTVRGLLAQADSAGAGIAGLYADSAGSWVSHGTAALPAAFTSGTLWLRLVYSAGGVSAFAGSGATIPSTWTQLAAVAPVHAISGPGTVTQIVVYAGRGGGSGDYVVEWSDIQWRSLLGAPT